jgi:adenine phosphoribosyltransferase
VLAAPDAFAAVVDAVAAPFADRRIDKVVGIEARGFVFAAPVAYRHAAGFVPVRKAGKLPAPTYEESYELEYASASIEVHQDAFVAGDRVLIVDDVLATGGTAEATAALVARAGGLLIGVSVLVELAFLGGRKRLEGDGTHVHALLAV